MIMISIYCGHLQTVAFIGVLVMTLFYFSFSSSVISLIKKMNSQNDGILNSSIFHRFRSLSSNNLPQD
jgi:hypothetical protein